MFCRCETGLRRPPNTHTCPVCLAFPGALPVPNRRAVEWTIKLGLALGCEIAEHAVFHRKNYFYPDNPKGYQISQYDEPLCVDGSLRRPGPRRRPRRSASCARISRRTRRRQCMSAARPAASSAPAHSLVDFNRGGTPLVEIVTQPDIRSAERGEALPAAPAPDDRRARRSPTRRWRRARCAATPTSPCGRSRRDGLSHSHRAEEHELVQLHRAWHRRASCARQIETVRVRRRGRAGDARLRGRRRTRSRRAARKEEADDYRYFPEPDLVPLEPPVELVERAARRSCWSCRASASAASSSSTGCRTTTPRC